MQLIMYIRNNIQLAGNHESILDDESLEQLAEKVAQDAQKGRNDASLIFD